VIGNDHTRLALIYGSDGELAGFSTVRTDCVSDAGRTQAVIAAGGYFRAG
jgi:hypothetical protein